jgi:hypothetical protein
MPVTCDGSLLKLQQTDEDPLMHNGMKHQNGADKPAMGVPAVPVAIDKLLHPAWRAFIRYCAELQHGEIELLKIQDGLPMLAEAVKKKVKFAP